jgi:hypothetical protein
MLPIYDFVLVVAFGFLLLLLIGNYPHKPHTFRPQSFLSKLLLVVISSQTSKCCICHRWVMFRCAGQRKGVVCLWRNKVGRGVVAVFQARIVACRLPAVCMMGREIWDMFRCLHCWGLMRGKYIEFYDGEISYHI